MSTLISVHKHISAFSTCSVLTFYFMAQVILVYCYYGAIARFMAWCSGNALCSLNEVALHQARLVLQWLTACEQVNHLSM